MGTTIAPSAIAMYDAHLQYGPVESVGMFSTMTASGSGPLAGACTSAATREDGTMLLGVALAAGHPTQDRLSPLVGVAVTTIRNTPPIMGVEYSRTTPVEPNATMLHNAVNRANGFATLGHARLAK